MKEVVIEILTSEIQQQHMEDEPSSTAGHTASMQLKCSVGAQR